MLPKENKRLDLEYKFKKSSRAKRVSDSDISIQKLIFFFLLAIIPALLLGYIIIYGAYKLESKQKHENKQYQYYPASKQDYWQIQEKTKQNILDEERRKKSIWGSLHKINQDLDLQKEALRLQQEQLKAEQERINSLLQQFKNK